MRKGTLYICSKSSHSRSKLTIPKRKSIVCAYRSTTATVSRGVIHGVSPDITAEKVVKNTDSDFHNMTHARPIGRKGTFFADIRQGRDPEKSVSFGKL